MSVHSLGFYRSNGRLRGMFVYMLFCQDDASIYVKVGISNDPTTRFRALRNGCPVTPKLLVYVEARSKKFAKKIEDDLLKAMDRWRQAGEWLRLTVEDKDAFKAQWQAVLSKHSDPTWPLKWSQLSVKELDRQAQQRLNFSRRQWRKRGRAYQDFLAAQ